MWCVVCGVGSVVWWCVVVCGVWCVAGRRFLFRGVVGTWSVGSSLSSKYPLLAHGRSRYIVVCRPDVGVSVCFHLSIYLSPLHGPGKRKPAEYSWIVRATCHVPGVLLDLVCARVERSARESTSRASSLSEALACSPIRENRGKFDRSKCLAREITGPSQDNKMYKAVRRLNSGLWRAMCTPRLSEAERRLQ